MDQEPDSKYLDFFTSRTSIFCLLITCVMLLIFVADLQFTTEIFMGALYLIVIMLSLWLPSTKYTLVFAILCTLLTGYGYFSSIYNFDVEQYINVTGFINLSMTICALWITSFIAIYIKTISNNLKTSESIHRAILTASIDPIVIIDQDGIIESASNAIEKTFGWSVNEVIGLHFDKLLAVGSRSPYTRLFDHHIRVENSYLIGQTHEVVGRHRIKRDFACEVSINYIVIPELNKPIFTAVLRDISLRKATEEKMGWLTTHDELTKIHNRRYFNEHIDLEWKRSLRSQESLAIIMIDIDFFKCYNDYLGHQAGDICLQKIAMTFSKSLRRSTDFVARYGGEEFAILLPATNLEGAIRVAELIHKNCENLNIPHPNSRVNKRVTVSMGIAAMIPTLGCTHERLIRLADQALYQAKATGRNRYFVCTD